jgi:predicted lipoprotein with Yx(FWY)xxD motif
MRYQKIVYSGVATAAAGLALAACGSGGGGGGGGNAAPNSSAVSVRTVSGVGSVLVDSSGKTLYFADQESGGQIHCTGACLQFWQPLKAAGGMPQAAGVPGNLATIQRPDGITQVTFDGHPLYTFTEDSAAGNARGNGFTDSFNGTTFRWHASTVNGAATPNSPTPGNGGGYGNGY